MTVQCDLRGRNGLCTYFEVSRMEYKKNAVLLYKQEGTKQEELTAVLPLDAMDFIQKIES